MSDEPDGDGFRASRATSAGVALLREPALLGLLLVATGLKLWLLAATFGTNDAFACFRFGTFAHGTPSGFAGAYAAFAGELNHPPLGLLLMADAIELWQRFGVSSFFWLRLPALAGDLIATVVVAELLRARVSAAVARPILMALIASPLSFAALYHGNTDLLWAALALAAALELERANPARAGALLAVAVGVKLPALVAVAPLAVVAWREQRLTRFAAAFAATLGAIFLPAIAVAGEPFVHAVFGYRGTITRQPWPPAWVLGHLGPQALDAYRRAGGPLALLVSAASALAFRRRGRAGEALLVAEGVALLLAPSFGAQYLAWPAAALALLGLRTLLAYHLAAGLQAIVLYAVWGAFRGPFYFADSQTSLAEPSAVPAFVTWGVLAFAVVGALPREGERRS